MEITEKDAEPLGCQVEKVAKTRTDESFIHTLGFNKVVALVASGSTRVVFPASSSVLAVETPTVAVNCAPPSIASMASVAALTCP